MIHHFIHLLEGLGLSILALGVILGWFTRMIFHRIRHGKNAHQ